MARQALWLEAIERRVAVTSAMLGSMKGVKMCGLTQHLMTKIQDMRLEELAISEKFRKLLIWNMGLGRQTNRGEALENILIGILAYLAPIMAPVLTFTTYSLLARNDESGTLDTTRVFTSLSLFALLQEPLSSFIMSLATFVGSVGCFVRIQAFLQSDVREDHRMVDHGKDSGWSSDNSSEGKTSNEHKGSTVGLRRIDNNMASGNAVTIKDGSFGWDSSKSPTLPDISLDVPAGKFTLIVGPVGSGKSTLLKAILGEVAMRSGAIQVSASEIAYCDQTPWHMNGTVRDSIIAFSGEDERWYQLVVRACALEEDFRQLPRGDGTQIGSKGIALSGGQSQRISLARAVYAQKDIVILDDVFSGLDAHTENNIFHNLLGGDGILRRLNTTVIVTSSRTKRLPYADHIVVLGDGGHITEQGSSHECSLCRLELYATTFVVIRANLHSELD
jgi:ATP-binding cassette subfamily C (CFTR/MRP) protein 1